MGGSTNTVLHLLAAAQEAGVDFAMSDIDELYVRGPRPAEIAVELFHAAPGCRRSASAFSQSERWESLDLDPVEGCIHDVEHAHSVDGGLAILYGNLAERGCVVKTAGVDESILRFSGPAVVVESQEEAVDLILGDGVRAGDVSPEAASGGAIALVRVGDTIAIDIPARSIDLEVGEEELGERRRELEAAGGAPLARL